MQKDAEDHRISMLITMSMRACAGTESALRQSIFIVHSYGHDTAVEIGRHPFASS